jgi:hypothetical protein
MMYQPIQATENMECIICYEPITEDGIAHESDQNNQLLHEVHVNCIKSWIVYSNSDQCPLCKIDINANKFFTLFERAASPLRYFFKNTYLDILAINSIGITAIATYSQFIENNNIIPADLITTPVGIGALSALMIHIFQQNINDHESFFVKLCMVEGFKLTNEIIFSISGFFIDSCLENDLQKLTFQTNHEAWQHFFVKTNLSMISLMGGARLGKSLIQRISWAWQVARLNFTARND